MNAAITGTRVCLTVPATEIIEGDEIRDPDLIPIRADRVAEHAYRSGFVVVDYTLPGTSVTGSRIYALTTPVYIHRLKEAGH